MRSRTSSAIALASSPGAKCFTTRISSPRFCRSARTAAASWASQPDTTTRRRRYLAALACETLERATARRIETRHLLRKMTQRDIAVLGHQPLHFRLSSQGHVLVALVHRRVVVGL